MQVVLDVCGESHAKFQTCRNAEVGRVKEAAKNTGGMVGSVQANKHFGVLCVADGVGLSATKHIGFW